jgi:hypothetical protein
VGESGLQSGDTPDGLHGGSQIALITRGGWKYQGVPPYKETQNYIDRVLSIKKGLKQENSRKTDKTAKDE